MFSLNFLNSLMTFVVLLLSSESRGSFRQLSLANLSTGLVGCREEIRACSFILFVFLQ